MNSLVGLGTAEHLRRYQRAVSIAVKRFERRLKAEKPLAQLLKRTTGEVGEISNVETQPGWR